jgi:hypothetical protein
MFVALLLACSGGSETASALLLPTTVGVNGRAPTVSNHHRYCQTPLFYSTSDNSIQSESSSTSFKTEQIKEMALRLMEENVMPTSNTITEVCNNSNEERGSDTFCNNSNEERGADTYDDNDRTPVESEFMSLTSSFLSYTKRDIRSLTTTYTQPSRSKEDGIRYRTLYAGVQAASSEPEVLRAFTILFEDYAAIRLAGRRIYAHLTSVMEVVRQERLAEIARTCELCPDWARMYMDDDGGKQQTVIEYARDIWDEISDEAMLLEDQSLDSSATGVISLTQLIHLGIDQLMIQEGYVSNIAELQCLVRAIVLQEGREMEEQYTTTTTTKKVAHVHHDDTKEMEMTFATFMKVLYSTLTTQPGNCNIIIRSMIHKIEQQIMEHRSSSGHHLNKEDISTRLATKAIITGSTRRCKWSQRFDEYVSTFKYWEQQFLNNEKIDDHQTTTTRTTSNNRRFEILRGCFVGARNEKNVAALKIVYMDYAALRIGGDLIFQLMSKIANKLM